MFDPFISLHSNLEGPLRFAAALDSFRFFEDEETLEAYKETLWASHVLPHVGELFGEGYAEDLEWTSSRAALLLHFLRSLSEHIVDTDHELTEN